MIGDVPITDQISLYFHIPFCKRKCDYCHFYVLPEEETAKEHLLEGFKLELELLRPYLKNKHVVTLYFGGGTPSLFAPFRIAQIIERVKNTYHLLPSAEITLEANPENITFELMQAYAQAGINRVSIGIQTLDSSLLTLLGRLHSPDTALQSIYTTYHAGIQNISIDLMYDLPKQTLRDWEETLNQIQILPLQHLSLYNLTIEPHTLFFKNETLIRPWLPDEETSLAMYQMSIEKLEAIGLNQYEISAFAKPGAKSMHNTGYWTARPFFGLGPSAFSYWQGKRFRHVAHLGRYCQSLKNGQFPIDYQEELDPAAQKRELFVIQLRLREGVSLESFSTTHGPLDQTMLKTLNRLMNEGYIHQQQGRQVLSEKGILFYDTVASELI